MIGRIDVIAPDRVVPYYLGMRTLYGVIDEFTDEYIEGVRVIKVLSGGEIVYELVGLNMIISYVKK